MIGTKKIVGTPAGRRFDTSRNSPGTFEAIASLHCSYVLAASIGRSTPRTPVEVLYVVLRSRVLRQAPPVNVSVASLAAEPTRRIRVYVERSPIFNHDPLAPQHSPAFRLPALAEKRRVPVVALLCATPKNPRILIILGQIARLAREA